MSELVICGTCGYAKLPALFHTIDRQNHWHSKCSDCAHTMARQARASRVKPRYQPTRLYEAAQALRQGRTEEARAEWRQALAEKRGE